VTTVGVSRFGHSSATGNGDATGLGYRPGSTATTREVV
jgi:hypothetical protein